MPSLVLPSAAFACGFWCLLDARSAGRQCSSCSQGLSQSGLWRISSVSLKAPSLIGQLNHVEPLERAGWSAAMASNGIQPAKQFHDVNAPMEQRPATGAASTRLSKEHLGLERPFPRLPRFDDLPKREDLCRVSKNIKDNKSQKEQQLNWSQSCLMPTDSKKNLRRVASNCQPKHITYRLFAKDCRQL